MNSNFYNIYKTLNILCVEDDEDMLEVYKQMFSLIFKNTFFASNGQEGFNYFENEAIDIIITDYKMPICNGLEMSDMIRKIDATIPIVMVTALENSEILRDALDVHITGFIKKPFTSSSMFSVFNLAVKSVIADRMLLKQQTDQILYNDYQENLTFSKESIITKNDSEFTHKMLNFQCEVLYKPKDTLSGDSYVLREIGEEKYFIFLVDGMGHGVSASVTAMMCSAFVDYYITDILDKNITFTLDKLLHALFRFIHPNLLENEVISAHFLYFDKITNRLDFAIFSMPPILYTLDENKLLKIKSNNFPITDYSKEFTINSLNISKLSKMLIFTDGLNENSVKESDATYSKYLANDFMTVQSVSELESLRASISKEQDDDITYVLLS